MSGSPRTFRSHAVYVRSNWADEWTLQDGLFADQVKFTCSPEIARADLSFKYGKVMPYGQTSFSIRPKLDLSDKYVKIVITQTDGTTQNWYGVVVDTIREQGGDGFVDLATPANDKPERGRQKFVALGLEYLLEREVYDSSFAKLTTLTEGFIEGEVYRGLGFNMGGSESRSRRLVGNMEAIGDKGAPVFSFSIPGTEWDGDTIIEYLLAYHSPKDKFGITRVKFKADLTLKDSKTLKAIRPKLDCHGESVKRIIDSICDRRRALSWYLAVDETTAPASVNLKLFTFNEVNIPLPDGGGTIAANEDAVTIDLASDPRVIGNPLRSSATTKYHRVIARGAPATLTLSLQATKEEGQGTLVRDWTDAQVTLFNAGASGDAGYAGLPTDSARIAAHLRYRTSNAMERVYRYFLWSHDDVYVELPEVYFNDVDPIRLWPAGSRFLPHIPLKYDVDYTSPSINAVSLKPSDSVDEQLRPFGIIKDNDKYYRLDKLNGGEDIVAAVSRHWGASLRMRHDQLGVAVDVHGAGQECLATDEFTPADSVDVDSGRESGLRWQDMILTVAVELDNWAEAQWPEPATPLAGFDDCIKELVIEVPERRMDYVAKNCVFDIDAAGAVKKSTSGGWITDDSAKLKWVAAIAWQWYQTERKALEYTFRSLDCPYHVGQLVTDLITSQGDPAIARVAEEINSPITAITFDMRAGTYTLATAFANLDARGLVL